MQAQLELIARRDTKPGCNFSQSPLKETWYVNLRVTDTQNYPFILCEKCTNTSCFRFKCGNLAYLAN